MISNKSFLLFPILAILVQAIPKPIPEPVPTETGPLLDKSFTLKTVAKVAISVDETGGTNTIFDQSKSTSAAVTTNSNTDTEYPITNIESSITNTEASITTTRTSTTNIESAVTTKTSDTNDASSEPTSTNTVLSTYDLTNKHENGDTPPSSSSSTTGPSSGDPSSTDDPTSSSASGSQTNMPATITSSGSITAQGSSATAQPESGGSAISANPTISNNPYGVGAPPATNINCTFVQQECINDNQYRICTFVVEDTLGWIYNNCSTSCTTNETGLVCV
ncbi:uncharacterized protein IL334_003673 [Kwoniella shivajii]|uniref:ShKT domain-containing protein n=1 Tax=Kwoniella shivajii TaxID=564305 RepID=A0ABZ1CZX2_9TREE|nr:hypothetical protein IL334_003673 [Kwoniella shivajii]